MQVAVDNTMKRTLERTNSRGKNTLEETSERNLFITIVVGLNSKKTGIKGRQMQKEGRNVKRNTVHTNQARIANSTRATEATRRKIFPKAGKRTSEATTHFRLEMQTSSGNK